MPWACPAAAHRDNPQRSGRAREPCRRRLAGARAAGAPGGGHRGRAAGRPGTGGGGRAGAAVRCARGGRAAAAGGGGPGPGRASRPVRAASVRPVAAAWCPGAWRRRRRREGTRTALRLPSRGRAEPGCAGRRRRRPLPRAARPSAPAAAARRPAPRPAGGAAAEAAPGRGGAHGAPLVRVTPRGREGGRRWRAEGGGAGRLRCQGHLECPGAAIMGEMANWKALEEGGQEVSVGDAGRTGEGGVQDALLW